MNLSQALLDNFQLRRIHDVGLWVENDITELEILIENPHGEGTNFNYATYGSQLAVAILRLLGKRS